MPDNDDDDEYNDENLMRRRRSRTASVFNFDKRRTSKFNLNNRRRSKIQTDHATEQNEDDTKQSGSFFQRPQSPLELTEKF